MRIHGSGFLAEIGAFPQVDRDIYRRPLEVPCAALYSSVPDPFRRRLLGSGRMLLTWGVPAVSKHEVNQKSFAPIMSSNMEEKVLPK
jgi:hypothetical protein